MSVDEDYKTKNYKKVKYEIEEPKREFKWGNEIKRKGSRIYYDEFQLGNDHYKLGDFIFLLAKNKDSGEPFWIAHLQECYKEGRSNKVSAFWFWRPEDEDIIPLLENNSNDKKMKYHDDREIFYSNFIDDNEIENVFGKCEVHFVKDVKEYEPFREEWKIAHFYCQKMYNYDKKTFEELPEELIQQSKEKYSVIVKEPIPTIIAMDLYAGCGGFSTGFEFAGIHTKYAVELDEEIGQTYHLNHPNTHLHVKDVALFYKELMVIFALHKRYPLNPSKIAIMIKIWIRL